MQLDSVRRILDLSRLLPGPYATQLLADAGADVIKVEDTDAGITRVHTADDGPRRQRAVRQRQSRQRSIAVDLKSAAGRDAFYRLVADADVVFEQFRPGVAERLEIDYETLLGVQRGPRLLLALGLRSNRAVRRARATTSTTSGSRGCSI